MLFLLLCLARRHSRAFLVHLLAFSLIWTPVMQARAIAPAVVLVPIGIAAARVFVAAATRVGSQLTATNVAAGSGLALVALAGENWTAVVNYTSNAAASWHSSITGGVLSFASLASSVGVTSVSTDVSSYSWSATAGNVNVGYGNVPIKDARPGNPGDTAFAFTTRHDGNFAYQPLAGNTFSTVYNASGFKNYLCPLMPNPSAEPTQEACRGLPEMPFGTFQYGTQYMSIGLGCKEAIDCAKAYISARLVQLSWLQGTTFNPQGMRNFANAVNNVSANFGSCFDTRVSSYTAFPGYRCPVTLSYNIAALESSNPGVFNTVTENFNIDVNLQKPSFSQAQTLNDYIDRYPLAGSQPIAAASLAQMVNAMFLQAANRAGYSGINYFPITAADAAGALQPGEVVPLSSITSPVVAGGAGTVPGNPTAPGGSATLDLGPNPNIAQPGLEGIPTAAQIMAPVFDLFPSLRNFQVPGHTSQCPALSIPLWGQDISTNKHCELIEGQRAALGAAALVGWSIAALIIVLGA
ncbi:MAG: hypothetical protein QE488_06930 [Acidovorax sp.]|nr:hypothetical protein [Acidovorax sp.]